VPLIVAGFDEKKCKISSTVVEGIRKFEIQKKF
jgi:hypothetical protein